MSNIEALLIMHKYCYREMRHMDETECKLWWKAKSILRDSIKAGQISQDQIPAHVEI